MKRATLLLLALLLIGMASGSAGCRSAIRGGEHDGEFLLAWPRTAIQGASYECSIFEYDDPLYGIIDEWDRTVTLDGLRLGAAYEWTLIREEF
ncbi:MAG: hypothetical protein JXP34_15070 [Planctomycetes bacterium]|nr:hypothetical protein [Planctomycetota bacterium]